MAQIDWVVKHSRRIEHLLREYYQADGRGLHQLITSCESRIPKDILPKLRFIATIRNKVVHEDGFKVDDRRAFLKACRTCEQALAPRSGRWIWGVVIAIMVVLIALSLGFYAHHWHNIRL